MKKLLAMAFAIGLPAIVTISVADQNKKTVFVTRMSYESNLGGLAGADEKCQSEADDPSSIVPPGAYNA